ncbi:hypothetical protein BOX15_Mlig007797g3 [Macrostomum lignano]|uniref:Sugar transporter SWEET n=1 Tax=Macrostomum lignano TaxID=282301 RepID=A0A267GSM6_9PLAT|nr:hypothetical protein BOX15_Mlig007797g3 [Macrostomum lignano]
MAYVSHFIELKLKLLAKILNHFRPSSYHVYKTKDASNAPVLFFLFSIANGLGWLHYGSLIGNFNLITLNGIGLALNSAYVILYLIYSPDWTSFSYKFTALLAYFSALYYHLYWLSSHDEFVRHLGASCSLVNTVFMLLPLLDIGRMLASRDAGGTHLPILLAGALCSGLWSLYGQAIGDFNVVLPNLMGVSSAVACLIVRFYIRTAYPAAAAAAATTTASGGRKAKRPLAKKDS